MRASVGLKLVVAAFAVASLGVVAACGSDATSSVAMTEVSPSASPKTGPTCSNGTPYDSATVFPELDPSASIPERECVVRCGDTSRAYWGAGGGPSPTVSALPTGSCDAEESCTIQAVRLFCQPPPDGSSGPAPVGALMRFVCRCSDHEWHCSGSYLSGGAGVYPPCPDGGD